jgi:hypothetical protein
MIEMIIRAGERENLTKCIRVGIPPGPLPSRTGGQGSDSLVPLPAGCRTEALASSPKVLARHLNKDRLMRLMSKLTDCFLPESAETNPSCQPEHSQFRV